MEVDVDLSEAMCEKAAEAGLITRMMRNPDFRVDYGTITSCHMLNPKWDKPVITISSNRNTHYYSAEVMIEQALALVRAQMIATPAIALSLVSASVPCVHARLF